AIRASRAAVPHMRRRGGGAIVMVASIYGRESGGRMTYNAVKAAEISLAKSMARDLAKDNIRVNSVAPGSIVFPGGSWHRPRVEGGEMEGGGSGQGKHSGQQRGAGIDCVSGGFVASPAAGGSCRDCRVRRARPAVWPLRTARRGRDRRRFSCLAACELDQRGK